MENFHNYNVSESPSLQHDDNYIRQLHTLTGKYFSEQNYPGALDCLYKIIAVYPDKPEYLSGIALILKKTGNYKEAEKYYARALEINPAFFEAYFNLGIMIYESGNIDEAINYFKKAVEINPGLYIAYYNLGNAYREKNEYEASADYYSKAIELKPDFDDAYYNLGVVNEKMRRLEKAAECYKYAIAINPRNLNARWNYALLYLQSGDYDNGWIRYEVRKEKDNYNYNKRSFLKPGLTNEPVSGKKIFVYCEQGLGDTIQFSRYLSLLKERGAYVIFECKPALMELFSKFSGIDLLIREKSPGSNTVEYDYYISLMSLPLYFKTSYGTIPDKVPYLTADRDNIIMWQDRIDKEKSFNIGIAWSGADKNISGRDRSCTLSDFSPLFNIAGVKLYSLQKNEAAGVEVSNYPLVQFENFDKIPFTDTAALMENLDLIISIDTSILHLAGALGRPVWAILPYYSDWRWMLNRTDSPWYPSMKLFRQEEHGQWGSVFDNVAAELKNILILNNKITV